MARAFPLPQFHKSMLLQPEASSESHAPDKRSEVLVVDDQPDSLNLLLKVFARQGFDIRIAPNAALALQSILVQPPDLILLDLNLPDKSGFDVCKQLQADPVTRHIPIIFISAETEGEAKAEAFRLGGVDFISKPFEAVELLARVNNQLKIQELWCRSQKRNEHQQKLLKEHRALKQLLYHEKELAEVTLQSIGEAVVTADAEGRITSLNPLAEQLLQLTRHQAKGKPIALAFRILDERTGCLVDNPVTTALNTGDMVALDEHHVLINTAGQEFPINESIAPIRDRHGSIVGAVMVFRDITESREIARKLSWQATRDPLTQLINRSELERQLADTLEQPQISATLCYMDLDRFKIVNDTSGHKAGDELLRQVTLTMQQQLSTEDILARVGGDEFVLILANQTPEQAEETAEKLCRAVQQFCFVWEKKNFRIGVSIGLVHLNADYRNRDITEVLNYADAACYYSKNQGRNQVQVYCEDDRDLNQKRDDTQWINRLNLALEEARFCLYGQPIMAISPDGGDDGAVKLQASHQEVLIRMIGEDGELIPPMSFIPIAERYDLMPEIDLWVVKTFLRYYSQTADQQVGNSYTINLSGASINSPKFVDTLEQILCDSQVPMEAICFEITETAAIRRLHAAAKSMRQLKKLGCSFALDDFGSGMSSLSYLKHLPVDYLKIDGSFVRNIDRSPIDRAMVKGFIEIAQVMNIKTIAEYAESDAILRELQDIGADYAQGYAVAQPHLLFIEEGG